MSDVIFIAVMIAFFVLCALYVQLCDRMIGPDDPAMAGAGARFLRSTAGPRPWSRARGRNRGDGMIAAAFDNAAGLVLAVLAVVYLLLVLVFPERF